MKPVEPSVPSPSPSAKRKPPVRVKLQRVNCDYGTLHPPQGQGGNGGGPQGRSGHML